MPEPPIEPLFDSLSPSDQAAVRYFATEVTSETRAEIIRIHHKQLLEAQATLRRAEAEVRTARRACAMRAAILEMLDA